MARSEDGEFELILGNKQLLSVFFIVVVLLGVFFTMGYIVGKNSVSPEMAAGKAPPTGAIVVEPPVEPTPKPRAGLVVEPDCSHQTGMARAMAAIASERLRTVLWAPTALHPLPEIIVVACDVSVT